jgi:nifR3 family TIM-barrel protein
MQDITDLPFWRVLHQFGGPDIYYTEYHRVHRDSIPEKDILKCIEGSPSGRPVMTQMIGEHVPALVRTAKLLQKHNVIGIDLNMGCPAPIVCRKSSGGALFKHLAHIDRMIGELREAIDINFTVKCRLGFENIMEIENFIPILHQHKIDALTVHGRTVKEMYRSAVHYDRIGSVVQRLDFPVFANGNIISAQIAKQVIEQTHAKGLMIGRGCIRNPWIFNQIRELFELGQVVTRPTLKDVRKYIDVLWEETLIPTMQEIHRVSKIKKYLHFIAQGVDPEGAFLDQIKRVQTEKEFFQICDRFLNSDELFTDEPTSAGLINSGNPRGDCYL